MRKIVALTLVCAVGLVLIFSGCKKKKTGGGTTEANLAVTLNPAVGSVVPAAVGPYNLSVVVTSAMPAGGVKVDVTAKKDDGTNPPAFFSQTVSNSNVTNNFTITGTTTLVTNLVEVKVTSLSTATNIWTGSYRFTSK